MSIFSRMIVEPEDEVFEMNKRYIEDHSDVKINLTVGSYKVFRDFFF